MGDSKHFRHESGWWEVLRTGSIVAAGILVIVAILVAARAFAPAQRDDFNEDAVTAKISATSSKCSPEFPLEVSLSNVHSKDALSVGFVVEVSDEGHSTIYHSPILGTDRIIPPSHTYRDCYQMPNFKVGTYQSVLAEGIPYTLASPQYSVVVSGVKLRGEN